MRIAFLGAHGVPFHGAFDKVTEEIGSRLVERGHEVTVYGRRRCVPHSDPYRGLKRVPLPSWDTKHLDTISSTFLSALHLITNGGADIAHIHGAGPALCALLPRLRGIKTVVRVPSLDSQRAKWGRAARLFLRFSEYAAVHWSDATIVVSPTVKDYLETRYGRSVHYVPNGVDIASPGPPQQLPEIGLESGKYLLFMGRLVPEKGCHYLIEAVSRLKPTMPLVMAGGDSHSERYVRDLKEKANSQVRFLGYVTGQLKEELLANAYLYIQPSDLEGMSLSLLEAMAYGRCILMSDIPENMLVTQDCAVTFRAGDTDHLTQQLANLLQQPQLVADMGKNAKQHAASHYSWDTVAAEVEVIYSRLIQQPDQAIEPRGERGELS